MKLDVRESKIEVGLSHISIMVQDRCMVAMDPP